jgi:hypothetical protein
MAADRSVSAFSTHNQIARLPSLLPGRPRHAAFRGRRFRTGRDDVDRRLKSVGERC